MSEFRSNPCIEIAHKHCGCIEFATADVTLTGWRLNRITEHLREGNLLALRSIPPHYANVDPTDLTIANIIVEAMSQP